MSLSILIKVLVWIESLSDQLLESLNVAGAFSQMYENVISYLQSIFFDFHIKTILAKYENQSIL